MNLEDLIYTRIKVGEAVMVCVSVGQITTLVVMIIITVKTPPGWDFDWWEFAGEP